MRPPLLSLARRAALGALLLGGCAAYDGRGLVPGAATVDDVLGRMGEPARRWQDADGTRQFAYPRGPEGPHTFMAHFDPDGRLTRLENVLDEIVFARIAAGRDDAASVERLLGPPLADRRFDFPRLRERVREWRYCDRHRTLARFGVAFDATTGVVSSTYSTPDYTGPDGAAPWCGRRPPEPR